MRKIELRKISYSAALSQETSAYAAQVWVDGVHICDVQNEGFGGCDMQYPAKGKTRADIEELDAYCKTLPPVDTGMILKGEPFIMEQTLDTVCGDLLAAYLTERDLKRLLKRTVAFVKPGTKAVMTYKGKMTLAQQTALILETAKKYPGAQILNAMPLPEAVKLYRETA